MTIFKLIKHNAQNYALILSSEYFLTTSGTKNTNYSETSDEIFEVLVTKTGDNFKDMFLLQRIRDGAER
jgi:hypothetical protein